MNSIDNSPCLHQVILSPESPNSGGSCVILRNKGMSYESLFIKSIDAYGHQIELIIRRGDEPNNQKAEICAYIHPGVRRIINISNSQYKKILLLLIDRVKNNPELLFNNPSCDWGKNHGFAKLIYSLVVFGQTYQNAFDLI